MFNTNRGEYGKEAENFALNFLKKTVMMQFRQNNILKKEAKNGQLKKMLNWEIFKF